MSTLQSIGIFAAGAFCAGVLCSTAQDTPKAGESTAQSKAQPAAQDIKAMMAKAASIRAPGKNHGILSRFVGDWVTETRVIGMAPSKGTTSFTWLMDGRWLQGRSTGTMMGAPAESFAILGYDNFKQSFVATFVSSMDTAMLHAEGDLDRTGKKLTTYGKMDEYLTGEHDKMVKYEWTFVSDDEIHFDVHDLGIGEPNTKVVSYIYKRK